VRALPEIPLLLATLAAPLLPLPWGIFVLLAVAFLWFLHRPPRREAVVVGLALAVAVAALAFGWWGERQAGSSPRQWSLELKEAYALLWEDLRSESATAARALGRPPETLAERLDAFRRLNELQEGHGPGGRRALLLLDPDGTPVAWAGEGLLHEPSGDLVPRGGMHYQAGFSAVTLLAVTPLDEARRPWRIVAGASFSNQTLPFPSFSRPLHWSLVDLPEQASPGAIMVRLAGAPTLVVEPMPGAEPRPPLWAFPLAWGAIAFALLALAVMRGVGLALSTDGPPTHRERRAWVTALTLGGVLAAGLSASLPLPMLIALVTGLAVAAAGLLGRGARFGERAVGAAVWGGGAVLALFAAAWGVQQWRGPLDLAASILAAPEVLGLRLAFSAAAFGLLCLLGRRSPAASRAATAATNATVPQGDRWAWASILLLLGGAAFADHPLVGLPLLAAGGATASLYVSRRRLGEGMTLAALAVMAVLVAAGVWETAYRLRLLTHTGPELLSRLAAPSTAEVTALKRRLDAYFTGLDLRDLSPRSPAGLERQDLAFAIWRGSPLARPYALSAVVVEPRAGTASSFSFGMPLNEERQVDSSPGRLEEMSLPVWEEALVAGQAELGLAGRPWGTVRYWLVPRPGFQLGERQRLEEVETGLLKGGPAASPAADLAAPALYALYAEDGSATLSPWEEAPPLEPRLRNEPGSPVRRAWTQIPSGPARVAVRAAARGWEAVYLPMQTPLSALERAASSALGVLLVLAFSAPFALLLAFPRAAFRDLLRRVVRSYSKRLMAIYTVLLFLPLLLLSFVLMRSMEERLERVQRVAGEAALASAQKFLGEFILTLPPGFDLGTALDDELLGWLSEVVHHEVNLYWGSNVYASSKHELFTAGLLPKRIPGEIYSRLVLSRYGLSSRTNRAGGTAYLELYAPLRIPGEPRGEERLFLSMPLLAQQEEAARNLAQMRRRGLLATAGLFILLVAVGARLARNFTRPLMQLVEGTRRIATGAPSLDLAPTELELAALVEAVDEMARRIAEGRERLVREKQVVETMVENITSGVVSLDRDRRVLMRNRVAAELLGAEVGESLQAVVERSGRLAPVADFLGGAGDEMARETVRLPNPADDAEGGEREWTLVWVPLPGAGEPSALLVAEDATEVLRSQRLLAWAEMARIIAHEIKNPLTPIRLSAEHMREVYRNDPGHFDRVFERCTSNILTQVDELRSIASEFSAYSAIPRIDPRPGDLTAAMAELVEGYRAAPPEGVSVDLETEGPIQTRFDAKLLGRAVRNLLENALRATSTSGGRVLVRVEQLNGSARIAVVDSGPGVRPDLLPRIFDPYFSTHDTGTGLGLPIARRIAEEHGGGIAARNRPEGGLEVVVTLPVTN
jgi:signal transduction histidine kinase